MNKNIEYELTELESKIDVDKNNFDLKILKLDIINCTIKRNQKLNKDEIENYKKNEYQEENYYYNYEILCFFVKVFFVFIMGLIAYFIAVKYVRKNW